MKQLFTFVSVCLFLQAQSQITWDMSTSVVTSGVPAGYTVSNISQGNNNGTTTLITGASASIGYAGASGGNNAGAATFTGLLNIATSTYFEFTITPPATTACFLNAIQFGSRSTASGPQNLSIRTSLDSYASNIAAVPVSNNSTWTLLAPAVLPINGGYGASITVRIYGSDGTGMVAINSANWRIDDLQVTVSSRLLNNNSLIVKSSNGQLSWKLADKTNLSHFSIETGSSNQVFEQQNRVDPNQTAFKINSANRYFRVVAHFANGGKIYSNVVYYSNTENIMKTWIVAQNLKLRSPYDGMTNLFLYNTEGALVARQKLNLFSGSVNTAYLGYLPKGIYYLILQQNERIEKSALIVQ